MGNNLPITSSELGTLWMTYQKKKMMVIMMEYFIEKAQDAAAKNILITYRDEENKFVTEIEGIFNEEGTVIPTAFGENDVIKSAKPLYDEMFHIQLLRIMMKVSSGVNATHLDMSYRKDIRDFYIRSCSQAQKTFDVCTDYLLEKGVLARAPYVTIPKEAEFVEDKSYVRGFNPFGGKRALNTVETAYIYQSIESHIIELQMLTGFAQVAKESEVRDYFIKGKELSKKVVSDLTQLMQQSDIQTPSTWAGRATDSTEAPFSDKIMMVCSTLLTSFQLASNALGTSFSLRSDLPVKLFVLMKDTYQFAAEGGQIMIKHRWLEEPPQMEDRNQLTKSKQ